MRGHPSQWGEQLRLFGAVAHFGGGGPSGNTTTTQTTTTAPWSVQQPYLAEGMQYAQQLLGQGGPKYYPGETYAPVTPDLMASLGAINDNANNGGSTALQADQSYLGNLLGSNYTAETQPGFQTAQTALTNATDLGSAFQPSNTTYGNLANGSTGASMFGGANGALTNYLNGSQLDPYNAPGFRSVVNNTLASVMPQIQAPFAGNNNRLDSGLATRAASEGATDAVGQLANQNYLQEQQNQLGAAGQAAGIGGQQIGALQAGAAGLSGNTAAQQQLQQSAAGQLESAFANQQGNQVRGSMFAPGADSANLADLSAGTQLGLTQQQNQQALDTAAQNEWNYNSALPWNDASMFMGLVNGNYGNSSTSTGTQPYFNNSTANTITGISGLAGAGASIVSALPTLLSFF